MKAIDKTNLLNKLTAIITALTDESALIDVDISEHQAMVNQKAMIEAAIQQFTDLKKVVQAL